MANPAVALCAAAPDALWQVCRGGHPPPRHVHVGRFCWVGAGTKTLPEMDASQDLRPGAHHRPGTGMRVSTAFDRYAASRTAVICRLKTRSPPGATTPAYRFHGWTRKI